MSNQGENQSPSKTERENSPKSESGAAMTTAEEQSNPINEISTTKIQVPFNVIVYKKDSFFTVKADPGFQNVMIYSNKQFYVKNENHILASMGLTEVTYEDMVKYFSPSFIELLQNQKYYGDESPEQNKPVK